MSTFREIVYMVLDENKLSNDDSYIEPEHVLFIISKLRAYLLTSKYQKMKQQISNSNFQTLTVNLEPTNSFCGCNSNMYVVRSTVELPNLLLLNNYEGATSVTPVDGFGCNTNFNMVNAARFNSVGYNKWLNTQNYVTIGPDNRLYIKSQNSDILEMEQIQVSAVFEDAEKAAKIVADSNYDACNPNSTPCDVMDMQFPLEEGLITLLIENASNTIYATESKPKDDKNSSSDELNSLTSYLNSLLKDRYRKNQQTQTDE